MTTKTTTTKPFEKNQSLKKKRKLYSNTKVKARNLLTNILYRWYKDSDFKKWTGITNQQAELINSTYKSNDGVYSRVDTLKSDSNLNTFPFPRKSTE